MDMARHRVFPDQVVVRATAIADAFIGTRKRGEGRSREFTDSVLERLQGEVETMKRTGAWGEAGPRHFVALYVSLYAEVYGIAPGDLDKATRIKATFTALRMLDKEFGDDPGLMANFMRWVWLREKDNEKWRRENGRTNARRIDWYTQFKCTSYLLQDYRLSIVRRRA